MKNALGRAISAGDPLTRHSPREARDRLRILLAEDNPVNQKLAVILLERQGHRVTVAENGRLALKAWETGGFDLILMDMMMPEMDGLEATRRIRGLERAAGRSPVAIIAMTANAMRGDEARCLEAGMDGYVSKPVNPETLIREITQVLARTGASPSAQAAPAHAPTKDHLPVFDRADALSRIADDEELLATLIDMFRDDAPGYLAEFESALAAEDMPRALRAAHTLKGVLATFSARRAEARARELEHLAKAGDGAACMALLPRVKAEVETFLTALT